MLRIASLLSGAFAYGTACSAGPQDGLPEPPQDSDGPTSDAAPATRTTPGCRFEERLLAGGEGFEQWPAPDQLAALVNHTYVGSVNWQSADKRPADVIEVDIEIDAEHVTLRYPVSPPRPQEPIICSSSLVVPITARLRLGDAETEISGPYAIPSNYLRMQTRLPESFAASFAVNDTDGYYAYLEIRFDGSMVFGKFHLRKGGVAPRTSAEFFAD